MIIPNNDSNDKNDDNDNVDNDNDDNDLKIISIPKFWSSCPPPYYPSFT